MQQTNAPDHSESMSCAYQLCRCPISLVESNISTARIKITGNGRSARVLFGSKRYPIELKSRWRAEIRSNITGKNTRALTNA
eukprot:475770-Pyramimonas_sp.AAC.1